jgi:hypothetical protein
MEPTRAKDEAPGAAGVEASAVSLDELAVLRALVFANGSSAPPTIAEFRAKHETRRPSADSLVARGLIKEQRDRLRLSLDGIYAADLPNLRDAIAHFNDAIPVLRDLYKRAPGRGSVAVNEVIRRVDLAHPVDSDLLRQALELILPETTIAQSFVPDPSTGQLQSFVLLETILDQVPLPLSKAPAPPRVDERNRLGNHGWQR